MKNDKVCPICGGLMIYKTKDFPLPTYRIYLCLHCGHLEVMGWNAFVCNHIEVMGWNDENTII